MTRSGLMTAVVLAAVFVAGLTATALRGAADETPLEPPRLWPAEVAPELRRIQRELGGSVVEGFSALRSAKPRAADGGAGLARSPRQRDGAVRALREAAAQLDVAANRLEGFELYRQADALREQAQRLRLDARGMMGRSSETSAATPALQWEAEIGPSPREVEPAPRQDREEELRPVPLGE